MAAAGTETPTLPVTTSLALPWLSVHVSAPSPGVLTRVGDALAKYARADGDTGRGVAIDVVPATDVTTANARALAAHATVAYQFVHGHAAADVTSFATVDGSLATLSHATRQITLAVTTEVFDAPYSTWADFVAAPLAELWRDDGCHPLHAAALTHGRHTALIVGASGAGKTTTALALLQAPGSTWRADDKVLLTVSGGALRGTSLYRNTNVAPATIRAFAALQFAQQRPPLDPTNDKRACLLDEVTDAVDLRAFAPTALIFPSQSGTRDSHLSQMDATTALLRLAGQSPMSSERGRARAHHDLLCRLAAGVPAFVLSAGTDMLHTPAAVATRVFGHLDATMTRR